MSWQLAAIGIAAVCVGGLLIYLAARWLVRKAESQAKSGQRVDDLEEQSRRRAKADEIMAKPAPTLEELDAWDRGE